MRGDFNARRSCAVHNPINMQRPRLPQGRLDRSVLYRLRASEGQDYSGRSDCQHRIARGAVQRYTKDLYL